MTPKRAAADARREMKRLARPAGTFDAIRYFRRDVALGAEGHSANCATTDAIAGYLIGPLVVRYPELGARMRIWAGDSNRWVRRAAVVSLIPAVRQGLARDLNFEIARRLHGDEEPRTETCGRRWALRRAACHDSTANRRRAGRGSRPACCSSLRFLNAP